MSALEIISLQLVASYTGMGHGRIRYAGELDFQLLENLDHWYRFDSFFNSHVNLKIIRINLASIALFSSRVVDLHCL